MTSLYYSHNKDHKKTTDNELEAEAEKGKQGVGALIRSSASSDSLRIRIIVGVRPTAAPRSSIPRAHARHGVVARERRAAYVPALPPSRDEGAERRVPLVDTSPVDADGGFVFASCSSRRRCSSYVVSSMLARLPAAGMGCLASSPSCAIYSQGKGMGIHSRDDRAEPLRCSGFDPHPPRRHGGCSRT